MGCSLDADILIRGCIILPMNGTGPIMDGAIAIKGRSIVYVGKASGAEGIHAERLIDAKGMAAMPGLVNTHTHIPMTIFRGIAEDRTLESWLKETIWPLEAKLTEDDVYYGALLGCLEMIKSGTTCFADMYFFEDAVARAVAESGLRAVLSWGIIEAGVAEVGKVTLQNSVEFSERWNGFDEGRIHARLAPHSVYTCSPELLSEVRSQANRLGVGIHIHLSESRWEVEQTTRKYGVTPVEHLEKLGFLGTDVLAAHCVHLTDGDMRILARRGVKVAYNPTCNAKLGMGIARVWEMHRMGVDVGIATDGPASNNTLDMLECTKIASILQKVRYGDPTVMPVEAALRMATLGGAKVLGLERQIGTLEPGKRADLILIDLRKPHLTPNHNTAANILYSARGSDVDTVIVDGKILMEGRQVKTLSEEEVVEKARDTAHKIVQE